MYLEQQTVRNRYAITALPDLFSLREQPLKYENQQLSDASDIGSLKFFTVEKTDSDITKFRQNKQNTITVLIRNKYTHAYAYMYKFTYPVDEIVAGIASVQSIPATK